MPEKSSNDFFKVFKEYFGIVDEDETMVSADDLIPVEELMNGEE